MRKKTTSLAHPASSKVTSEKRKPTMASIFSEPSPNGQPVSEEAIRLCAYRKWEAAGKPGGDGVQFWLEAKQELSQAK